MSFAVGSFHSHSSCRAYAALCSSVVAAAPDPTPRPSIIIPADPTGGPKRTLPGRLIAF